MSRTAVAADVSHRAFFIVSALIFGVSAAATIVCGMSMAAMGGMEMPEGWTMSMAWMRMPDQTWLEVGASFLGMWVVMMIAMMLPSLTPMLWRYRQSIASTGESRVGWLTAIVGGGYLIVWTLIGAIAFPVGAALATLEMQIPTLSRAVPLAVGVVVLMAGALQFTAWKVRQLACCRATPAHGAVQGRALRADARTALRMGVRLGLRCSSCCAGLTAILLVIGVMDLRAMALVTVAITAERLSPGGERVARVIGTVIVGAGLFLIAQAIRS